MINWKVRVRNRLFWTSLIPAVILVVQLVISMFGVTVDLSEVSGRLVSIADAIFAVLVILGIINDPTTHSYSDSTQAMGYTEPKKSY